ncbi:hypothetical protein DPMN_169995, partial [Dreissena polymorpha]
MERQTDRRTPNRSAMGGPLPGETSLLIKVFPVPVGANQPTNQQTGQKQYIPHYY